MRRMTMVPTPRPALEQTADTLRVDSEPARPCCVGHLCRPCQAAVFV